MHALLLSCMDENGLRLLMVQSSSTLCVCVSVCEWEGDCDGNSCHCTVDLEKKKPDHTSESNMQMAEICLLKCD